MRWIVIMAGGSGERFWPESRREKPKQLLKIVGRLSLIRQTFERAKLLCPASRILVVTNKSQEEMIKNELKELSKENIISEPVGRDTAACIGLAALIILKKDKDASMAVLPADHVIKNKISFKEKILSAYEAANNGFLVTFGMLPVFASTAYGYIEKGNYRKKYLKTRFFAVKKFHEKPNETKAKRFLRAKKYFWNSGMFVWRADVFLENLNKYLKITYNGLLSLEKNIGKRKIFQAELSKVYKKLPKISVDYAVMEKAKNVIVSVCRDLEWDDIGSWSSLQRHFPKDKRKNVVLGKVLPFDTDNCIIVNRNARRPLLTAVIGVKDLIIIQTDDAVLVCNKSKDQEIKKVLKAIDENRDYKRLFR
ncbi:MAG: mannose-1-phosphate guanylyltransferase [Candidatus Aureabacteria bacterium]|nr:mannose-1-phosphate guanylyltransferase [Candidatus Auribacterota bacterium]